MFDSLLVNPLFNLLAALYAIIPGHDFGLAIIVLVVLVRLLLWPIMSKQFHSQRALQELAPDVAKVKEKAKGDKQLEGKLLMELYKEREISPFGALKPTIIQAILLLALFFVIREIIKPGQLDTRLYEPIRNLPHLKALLAAGGELKASLLGFVDLTKPSVALSVLTGLTQFYQTKQITPKNAEGIAKNMQMMNIFLPAVFVIFTLNLPAALPLFWTVGSLLAILQQHLLLQRDVVDMEQSKASNTKEAKT